MFKRVFLLEVVVVEQRQEDHQPQDHQLQDHQLQDRQQREDRPGGRLRKNKRNALLCRAETVIKS